MRKIFLNLTNGIEALSKYNLDIRECNFIRIQSTACEQKRWGFILNDLDHNFLMNLAVGNECIIYDFGHNGQPKALWQGFQWIEYALNKIWLKKEIESYVKKLEVSNYWKEELKKIDKKTLRKIKYYRKFLLTDVLHLYKVYNETDKDGKYEEWKKIIMLNLEGCPSGLRSRS